MTATVYPHRHTAPSATRLFAAVIDLAIVALVPAALTLSAVERFRLLEPGTAPDRFASLDQQRIDEIGQGLNRAVELSGSLYAVDGTGLGLIALSAVTTVFLTLVVLPLATDGQSIGKAMTGLQVVADDDRPATAGQHAVRALAAPIDLLPMVVPGLAGALLAASDHERRRLGDRLAQTRVRTRPTEWVVGSIGPDDSPTVRPAAERHRPPKAMAPPPPSWAGPVVAAPTQHQPSPAVHLDHEADDRPERPDPPGHPIPAPPLLPVRRSDRSATRSPQSRRGATMADIDLVDPNSAGLDLFDPSVMWLGDEADYRRWANEADLDGTPTTD